MYKVLYSATGTGQISLGFRLSRGRQKWAMGPFPETEEKVRVTVPCTRGGHIQKFTKSFIAPPMNTFIKSYVVHLCIFFLNQDLSFHFVSQLDCEFLTCTDSVTLFCFLHIKSQYREHCIWSQTACVERQLHYQLCDFGQIGLCGPQLLIYKWGNTYSIKFS